jgi:hypothetical protein
MVPKLDALKKTAAHLAAQPKKKQEGNIVEMPGRAGAVSEWNADFPVPNPEPEPRIPNSEPNLNTN